MNQPTYPLNQEILQKEIYSLHMKRKNEKMPSKRKSRLTNKDREIIFAKTDGRCHVCGIKISLGEFQADHVLSHVHGGLHKIENYLPACFICNNYRWHYLPEELQLILKIGVYAKTEIENGTILGNLMAKRYTIKENRRIKNLKL